MALRSVSRKLALRLEKIPRRFGFALGAAAAGVGGVGFGAAALGVSSDFGLDCGGSGLVCFVNCS